MSDKLIVALDVDNIEQAEAIVDELYPVVKIFKVGNELFSATGPEVLKRISAKGANVFLDLKFHDIPNTVAKAVKATTRFRPFMVNVHASGGQEMIKAAAGSIKSLSKDKRPILLAVTVLTSIDRKALQQLGISRPPIKQVVHLAKTAKSSGADGVVCSPQEIQEVRNACGKKFIIVTPGIRPAGDNVFDQKRIATPEWAIRKGADFIVNITNDAWFKKSSAAYQHNQCLVFRAVENKVSAARIANTGPSLFIEPTGRIEERLINQAGQDLFIDGFLTADLLRGLKETFFTKFGDIFAYICIIFFAVSCFVKFRRQD